MIGGGMLMCAVGAMILIAWWSIPRDDEVDPATGLLALRSSSTRTVARKQEKGKRRSRRPVSAAEEPGKRDRRPAPVVDDVKRDRRPDPSKRRRRR